LSKFHVSFLACDSTRDDLLSKVMSKGLRLLVALLYKRCLRLRRIFCAVCVFLIFGVSSPAGAKDWYVEQEPVNSSPDALLGSAANPFRSISNALIVAAEGDTVIVRPGIYREVVRPTRSNVKLISVVPRAAIITGSEKYTGDVSVVKGSSHIFAVRTPGLQKGQIGNPFLMGVSIAGKDTSAAVRPAVGRDDELGLTRGQVFVNDLPYRQVDDFKRLGFSPGTWMVDSTGDKVLINPVSSHADNFQEQRIELTVRDRVFFPSRRGLKGIVVDGFIIERCANNGPFPQSGALSVRAGRSWEIKNNIIRYAIGIGLDIGSEYWDGAVIPYTDPDQRKLIIGGDHLVKNNIVENNGLCGICGWHTGGSVISSNVVRKNNSFGYSVHLGSALWEEAAGIKLHFLLKGKVEGNFVHDNGGPGIWLDSGFDGSVVSSNVVFRNVSSGVFLEYGFGPAEVYRNLIAQTISAGDFYRGHAVYLHDASNVAIDRNLLFANAGYGVWSWVVTGRKVGDRIVESSGIKVRSNLFVYNRGAIGFPLPGGQSRDNFSDCNVFDIGSSSFAVNRNNGRESFSRINLSDAPQGLGGIYSSSEARAVTFDDWRKFFGHDGSSELAKIKAAQFGIEGDFFQMSISDLKMPLCKDFALRSEGAGPFRGMRAGIVNTWILPSALH
jgi:hypothetical protein